MYTFWSWFLLWERFVLGLGDFQANSNGLWQNPTFSMNKSLLVLADSYNMFGMNDTFDANDLWMIHLIQMICYNDGHKQCKYVPQLQELGFIGLNQSTKTLEHDLNDTLYMNDKFDYEQYIWHEWYVNDMKSDTIETARSNDMWNDLDDMIDTNNMWMIVWCYLIQLTMWNWSREHIDTIETIDTIQLICEWYWCYYCYCFYHYLIQLIWWMNWKQDNIENTIDQYMDQRQAVSRKDH